MAQIASADMPASDFDRFNDASIFFPVLKIALTLVVLPVILILIFRTERMHVKFEYQLQRAKAALVHLRGLQTDDKKA